MPTLNCNIFLHTVITIYMQQNVKQNQHTKLNYWYFFQTTVYKKIIRPRLSFAPFYPSSQRANLRQE